MILLIDCSKGLNLILGNRKKIIQTLNKPRIKKVSEYAGIGFGVYKDYGAAQILYIKRAYLPDGKGIVKNSVSLNYGDKITIDDSIVFCLTKKL